MSREPIRWTENGRLVGMVLQAVGAFAVVWALLALAAALGGRP